MVYDTTSSNTGDEIGACRCLEIWLDTSILWLGCRHQISELHVKRVIKEVIGQAKDPGVSLFRRLKAQWYTIDIDYINLNKFDYSYIPLWMQEEEKSVLSWTQRENAKNT